MSPDRESSPVDFEREKWLADVAARTRELDLKEREQANRDADLELRRADQAASKWRSPLVVAILAATAAAGGNALIAVVNGSLQRDLDSRKRDAEIKVESGKAESTRILEMIKTGDAEKAASNLEFLLKAGLITDPDRVAKLTEFLKNRAPGGGPSLPAPDPRIAFESTESLTASLQGTLQKTLEGFMGYLQNAGFPVAARRVSIKVDKLDVPNAYYADGSIVIDARLSSDSSVALREYGHHALTTGAQSRQWDGQYGAIKSALADYFACSFLDNPRVGEKAAKVFNLNRGYIRMLANDRKFVDFQGIKDPAQMPYLGAEIWGGMFWALREKTGRETADSVIAGAWFSMAWPAQESQRAPAFVAALLASARAKTPAQLEAIRLVLRSRGFPLGG